MFSRTCPVSCVDKYISRAPSGFQKGTTITMSPLKICILFYAWGDSFNLFKKNGKWSWFLFNPFLACIWTIWATSIFILYRFSHRKVRNSLGIASDQTGEGKKNSNPVAITRITRKIIPKIWKKIFILLSYTL